MTRKNIDVSTTKSERDLDLDELVTIADRIDEFQRRLDGLFDRRRLIWHRRLESHDTTKAALARASRCHPMNVTQGVKPDLIAKAREASS